MLVHEALSPEIIGMMEDAAKSLTNEIMAKVMFDLPDYHASPREAAETTRDAGVGHLLYYHVVVPIIVPGQEALWLNGAGAIFPDHTFGYDAVSFSLHANSSEIIQTRKGMQGRRKALLHQFGTDTHSSPSSKGNAKCLSIATGASSSGS